MSFPDPQQAPIAFSDYLKAENLDVCLAVFGLYQTQPRKASNDRLDETEVTGWCDRMDLILVSSFHYTIPQADTSIHVQAKLARTKSDHPEYSRISTTLRDLCSQAVVDMDGRLSTQRAADTAAKQKREEEERARQEQEERDKNEKKRKAEESRARIEAAVREIALQKKALEEIEGRAEGGDTDEDNDDDNKENENDGSESLADQQEVRISLYFFYSLLTAHIRVRTPRSSQSGSSTSWKHGKSFPKSHIRL
jgi:hypothetical protein